MTSTRHVYPVPEGKRRPVPAWARAWGKDVDYPAPGLITEELQQNIHIDSIFVKSGELIIPDKCEECRLRAKGCDRARPLCGRCEKIGKTCIPVTGGYSRLRKGRGGKALPIRVWGQSEDPEKIDRDREERERLERERVERELKAKEAREAREAKELSLNMAGIVGPTRKRKRTESMPATTKQVYSKSLSFFDILPLLLTLFSSIFVTTISRSLRGLFFPYHGIRNAGSDDYPLLANLPSSSGP